jgi:hypothetical protein
MFHDMRALIALALPVMLLATAACVEVPELEHGAPTPTPDHSDRTDCGQILGSAFRSDAEQQWFTENCSDWAATTVGRLPDPTPIAQAAGQGGADPAGQGGAQVAQDGQQNPNSQPQTQASDETRKRCDAQRGRPYASDADRDWYLKNCLNLPATTLSPDVRDCNQIRGQNYASEEQRQWFLANCQGQGPANAGAATGSNQGDQGQNQGNQGDQQNQGGQGGNAGASNGGATTQEAVGPEGRPCSAIYGTRYRSSSERAWFSQNC